MPALIPYIAEIIGSYFWATVIAYAIEVVAMVMISKLLQPKPGTQLSDGATQEYSGTVEPRRIVYGDNLISGLNAIPPWCHGTNNQMLDQVLVLASHECAAITDCWANQTPIGSSAITAIAGNANDGKVTTGTYANKLWIRRYRGAASETVDWILHNAWASYWTSNCVGTGLAKLCLQYQYDATVYSSGKPDIKARVQGKILYDPRLDTAPGAHPTTSTYFAYSNNPALCIIDYLLDPILGLGEDPARIDWTAAVAAANTCDESVAVPLPSTLIPAYNAAHTYYFGEQCTLSTTVYNCIATTVGHTPPNVTYWIAQPSGQNSKPRYRCNSVLDCTANFEDNIRTLASSMQGAVLYSSGKWILLPGHWVTPTFAIGDDDIISQMDYQTALPYQSRYNAVRGQFYDPANLYQPTDYPQIRVSADETADGEGPVWQELQQPTCTDTFEAQRNAMIWQRFSRRKKSWGFTAGYSLWGIRPGEFGTLSITELGISNQYVKCIGWKQDGKSMTMQIQLQEASPSDWNDPDVATYQVASALSTPAAVTFVPDTVGNLTATSAPGGIILAWTLPAIWHSNLNVEVLAGTVNNIASATVVWSGVNTGFFYALGDTTTRYFWVRVRNMAGNDVSVTNPAGATAGLASNGVRLLGPAWTQNFTGNVQALPPLTNNYQKVGGSTAWDSSVYSSEKYEACIVSFTANDVTSVLMIGVNEDPATDSGYSTIDYALYLNAGNLLIYKSGGSQGSFGTYAAGDQFEISYDGVRVRLLKNNTLLIAYLDPMRTFALDTTFNTAGARVLNLSFGPLAASSRGVGNYLSTAPWKIGGSGTQGNFVDTYDGTNHSSIVLGGVSGVPLGPYGTTEPLWQSAGAGAAVDGGWYNSNNGIMGDLVGIDPLKTYRHAVWIRRHGTAAGYFYFGCDAGGGTCSDLAGTVNANPYFLQSITLASLTADKWYLAVGFVHGSGFGTAATGIGGIYDPVTGQSVHAATEYKQTANTTQTAQRCFIYATSNLTAVMYFARPRFEEVNGAEPSIPQLLSPSGILAYLDSVDTAQVANAAVCYVASAYVASAYVSNAV